MVWVINLGTEIDETQRWTGLTPLFATDVSITKDPAVQTDSTVGVLGFTILGAAGDIAWEFAIWRISTPS